MEEKLYIPMGVKTETEIFSGFGRKQLLQSLIGSIGAGMAALVVWVFTKSAAPSMVCVLAGIIGSVMMTTKDQTNLSVVDQVRNMVCFYKSQKYYPYTCGDEWGLWGESTKGRRRPKE